MISQCKNCAGQLVFDPAKQRLICSHCGSLFKPEEFDLSEKIPLWDKKAVSMNEVYGTDSEEFMDCYVYTCGSCGGEIIINGSEASTKCIYCGNSEVIFSRISRTKRPKYIIPFSVTKEEAVYAVREKFRNGKFVPGKIKKFSAEDVRGIYIPYWIVDCNHKGAVIIHGSVRDHKQTQYYGRAGELYIKDLPLDASKMLSDDSTSRLEPYYLEGLKPFDEDYLMGFYSNISDITYGDLRSAVNKRATDCFNEMALSSIHGDCYNNHVTKERHITVVDYDNMRYAMFPVWFVTYDYNGKHNIILVNGQSGKVVCGVPWNKVLFFTLLILAGIALTAVAYFIIEPLVGSIGSETVRSSYKGTGKALFLIISMAIGGFATGIAKIRSVIKSIKLSQSQLTLNFMKKRQG